MHLFYFIVPTMESLSSMVGPELTDGSGCPSDCSSSWFRRVPRSKRGISSRLTMADPAASSDKDVTDSTAGSESASKKQRTQILNPALKQA